MGKRASIMLDRPETPAIISGLTYGFLCFVSLPFLLLIFMTGSFEDPAVVAGCEIFYHCFNFGIVLLIFAGYLKEAFFNVVIDKKNFFSIVASSAALMLGVFFIWDILLRLTGLSGLELAAYGSLPMAEMELFSLCSYVIYEAPLLGTLCMVLIVPFTTSCLYYATTFAPIGCNRPWLAYIIVSVVIALPRICNAVTFWVPSEELTLYICQLPIHLIACRAYQKADTVWAPIVSLMIANLVGSLFVLFPFILYD